MSAKLLIWDNVQELTCYWIEDFDSGSCIPETILSIDVKPGDDFGDVTTIPAVHLTNGYAPIITKRREAYGNTHWHGWRCWTKRPSLNQMKAAKWGSRRDGKA